MDCRPPGSSVHGILQARILEWVVIPFSWSRDRTQVSHITGRFFPIWVTREVVGISRSWATTHFLSFGTAMAPVGKSWRADVLQWPYTEAQGLVEVHSSATLDCSVTQWCPTPCDPMDWSKPGFPVLYHLPDLAQTHVHWVGDTIHPCHPLLPPSLPALNLSQHQGLFQWVGCLQQVAKYWSLSFSFSISPSNEYSGLIFFRIDWFDLLAVQGALKSLLQHHNLFESISSSVLNLLYGPTLTLVHDYWKNHRFDYTDLCRQSGISVF